VFEQGGENGRGRCSMQNKSETGKNAVNGDLLNEMSHRASRGNYDLSRICTPETM
jgi:hypothetical protein